MLACVRYTVRVGQAVKQFTPLVCRFYASDGSSDDSVDTPKSTPVRRRAARPVKVGEYKDPWYLLSEEFKNAFTRTEAEKVEPLPIPRETDILVIGGGAIGSSVAYFLKQRNPEGFNVTVVERDPTVFFNATEAHSVELHLPKMVTMLLKYTRAATVLSVGGVRQQFSLKENIEMSLFAADFIRNIKEHLSIYGMDPPDVQFNPQGYLFLATEQGAETLHTNHKIQTELGAKVLLMTAADLSAKFPWMNTEGISCGCYGLENEGWFDPWLLLCALRGKATSLGANYIKGEVVGFGTKEQRLHSGSGIIVRKQLCDAMVKHENGETYPIRFAVVVNCAGPWAGEIATMAGLGVGPDILRVALPVEPRKRYVFVVHCPDGPGLETPMVIDPTGVYVRREGLGGHYVCGASPPPGAEPNTANLDVDYNFFNETVWPVLANRLPAFEALKEQLEYHTEGAEDKYYTDVVHPALCARIPALSTATLKSAWAGYYDYNYADQNLIIGNHPHHLNLMFATGCSGHGIQQAPAIGRALTEFILDDEYQTIDLSRFSFDRFLDNELIYESNIV